MGNLKKKSLWGRQKFDTGSSVQAVIKKKKKVVCASEVGANRMIQSNTKYNSGKKQYVKQSENDNMLLQ